MLKRWTVFPLRDVATIGKRLDVVETFFRKPDFRQVIDEQLHRIGDIERIISEGSRRKSVAERGRSDEIGSTGACSCEVSLSQF